MNKRKHSDAEEPGSNGDESVPRKRTFGERIYGEKFWGPYLSERQWGTVREETGGDVWTKFSYEDIKQGSYHWGEDGIFGLSDDEQKFCIGLSLWNGKDDIVKERFFGLAGHQGNHGEDVKELYFYLNNDPDHRYMSALYLYPQMKFPYTELKLNNKIRSVKDPEYELLDTGIFEDGYWHIMVEYGKPENDVLLCRYTVTNKGKRTSSLDLSPKFWFRKFDHCDERPSITKQGASTVMVNYDLGEFQIKLNSSDRGWSPTIDILSGDRNKGYDSCKATYRVSLSPGDRDSVVWRLTQRHITQEYKVEQVLRELKEDADLFYQSLYHQNWSADEKLIAKGAWVGLLWNKQFYYYDVEKWYDKGQGHSIFCCKGSSKTCDGTCRNYKWRQHFKACDILSVPDKWEFPWFAPWDTCFQMLAMCRVDPQFSKDQLLLLLSDRYMSPQGQIPGCEFNFDDNNPPIHAWTCLKVFRMTGSNDLQFLLSAYERLEKNYQWWFENLQCSDTKYTFHGGFLGLDNISIIDRGRPPDGFAIKQADATAWMALFALSMVEIAGLTNQPKNESVKYLTDFMRIAEQLNKNVNDGGFWNEKTSFYTDVLVEEKGRRYIPIEVHSLVGLLPLVASCQISTTPDCQEMIDVLQMYSNFAVKCTDTDYFLTCVPLDRIDLLLSTMLSEEEFLSDFGIRSLSKIHSTPYTLSIPIVKKEQKSRLRNTAKLSRCKPGSSKDDKMHSKTETLSNPPRNDEMKQSAYDDGRPSTSMCVDHSKTKTSSKTLGDDAFLSMSTTDPDKEDISIEMVDFCINYAPGEADCGMMGGNSNWRGPVWMCANYILLDALKKIQDSLGDKMIYYPPKKEEQHMNLIIKDICRRLVSIFLPDGSGTRPLHGPYKQYREEPWQNLILYYEYFNAETGQGCGASHQSGWTSLIAEILYMLHRPD